MIIQISGRVLLLEGGSKSFFNIQREVTHVGKGDSGNPKMPVGQFLPHEVKFKIHNGTVVVTVLFGIICEKKNYGLPVQQYPDDQVTITIDEFHGRAIGVAELHCFVILSNDELPDLHRRLAKMGYVGEAEVVKD